MKKSFTLIELLVVMVILSLIMSLTVPKGFKLLDKIHTKIEKKKKVDKIKEEEFKAFLSEKANKKLGINKYGIKEKFYNN